MAKEADRLLRDLVRSEMLKLRIGVGYDSHRYSKGRPMYLGGILIKEAEAGLDGHSDADVIMHAVIDAMLGAASQHDIGYFFPANDKRYDNISSMTMLAKAMDVIKRKRLRVVNADITVIAEVPKISPHISKMKSTISKALKVGADEVGIKAKTNERMGAIGRKEGMAAIAVVMLGPL